MSKRAYQSPAPKPPLDLIRETFRADPEGGSIFWHERPLSHFVSEHAQLAFNGRWAGREALTTAHPAGYHAGRITFGGTKFHIRRSVVIWALANGAWPDLKVGHRNQRFDDDRVDNLRLQTESQKGAYGRQRPGRSGVRGVLLNDIGGYVANIGVGGRVRYLGTFREVENAISARNQAAIEQYGEFARLSEIPST